MQTQTEVNWKEFGQKLQRLLALHQLSKIDLAKHLKLSPSMITRVFNGERKLGPFALFEIAKLFYMDPVELLYGDLIILPIVEFYRGEDDYDLPPLLLPRSEEYSHIFSRVRSLVISNQPFQELPKKVSGNAGWPRGKAAAEVLRKKIGILSQPITGVVTLMEESGIAVARVNAGRTGFRAGTFIWSKHSVIVVVSEPQTQFQERFNLAHELGHIILQRHEEGLWEPEIETLRGASEEHHWSETTMEEKAANAFAAYFLLPDAAIEKYVRPDFPEQSMKWDERTKSVMRFLSEHYGVDWKLIWRQFQHASLITEDYAESKLKEVGNAGKKHSQSAPSYPCKPHITAISSTRILPRGLLKDWIVLARDMKKLPEEEANALLRVAS